MLDDKLSAEPTSFGFGVLMVFAALIFGVLLDGASEGLKYAARWFLNRYLDYCWLGIDRPTWSDAVILALCAVLTIVVAALCETILRKSPPIVRPLLLVIPLLVVGAVRPWELLNKRTEMLTGFQRVEAKEPLDRIRYTFGDNPKFEFGDASKTNPKGYYLYCAGDCILRLEYDVPSFLHGESLRFDFNSKLELIHAERLDFDKTDCQEP